MAKKTYYESGDMFMNVERITKDKNLDIKSLGNENNFSASLSLAIDQKISPSGAVTDRKISKDSVNNKNILKLKFSSEGDYKNIYEFYDKNKKDILDVLRIARQYAKDNKQSLYIGDYAIPTTEYSNATLDKETNTVYPVLYDELKSLSEHNIPVTFQPRGYVKPSFSVPDDLKTDIDLTHNTNFIDIALRDKNDNVSYNMSNVSFTGVERMKLILQDKNLSFKDENTKENDAPLNIISFPEHDRDLDYEYSLNSRKPIVFKDNDINNRNVRVLNCTLKGELNGFVETLNEFFHDADNMTESEKKVLKQAFTYMKENNLDIIEQSKLLLNGTLDNTTLHKIGNTKTCDIYLDEERLEKNMDKVQNNIENILKNEPYHEMKI